MPCYPFTFLNNLFHACIIFKAYIASTLKYIYILNFKISIHEISRKKLSIHIKLTPKAEGKSLAWQRIPKQKELASH